MNASSSMQPVSPKVQEELTYLVREIKLLQSLKHPSLCELREYYLSASLIAPPLSHARSCPSVVLTLLHTEGLHGTVTVLTVLATQLTVPLTRSQAPTRLDYTSCSSC